MNNILILGGSGFIGRNIIESFSEDKTNKLVVVSRKPGLINEFGLDKDNIIIKFGFFEDSDFVENLIVEYEITIILHLVSGLIPSSSDSEFYQRINDVIIPTFKLIDFISNRDIKLIFFSSGGTIYGGGSSIIGELCSLNPINNYGFSKLVVEDYIRFKSKTTALNYIILRPSNVYGKYQKITGNQGFIPIAINKISNDEPIEIWGDGNSIRDYIHVDDVVTVLKKLIVNSVSNTTLNLSTGIGKSLLEIILLIEKYMCKNAIVHFNTKRPVDATTVILDNSELLALIPYEFISVDEGIKCQINYFNTVLKNAN